MKRLFILASAAALMLASCAKTTVVYNEAPEEIGFKAVTGVMTKAGEPTKLPESENLGVFAHLYDNSVEGELYFGNTQFTYDTDSWKGTKYWPISNGLIFTVYSPYNGTKEFREASAKWMKTRFGVDVDAEKEVLANIGSKEAIAHVFFAFVDFAVDPALMNNIFLFCLSFIRFAILK